MCVGGPADGERMKSTTPYLYVAEADTVKVTTRISWNESYDFSIKTHRYRYEEIGFEDERFCLWVHEDIKSAFEAFCEIFYNYGNKKGR